MYLVVGGPGGLGGVGMSLLRSMTVRPLLFDISLFQSQVPEDNADKGRRSEVRRDIDIRYTTIDGYISKILFVFPL